MTVWASNGAGTLRLAARMWYNVCMDIEVAPDGYTTWHITVGTYAARLHGGDRPTVERSHNEVGEGFVERNDPREQFERDRMRGAMVILNQQQREQIEALIPELCARGGWTLRACAAGPEGDHVHTLLDAPRAVHGKQIRSLLKRWLTQALDAAWGKPDSGAWWADGGSTRAVKDIAYLRHVTDYVHRQRATTCEPGRPRLGR